MTYEFNVCEGFTIQHYGADDWFPVVNAQWWVREWLMCDDESRVEVESADGSGNRSSWGEVRDMLVALGNVGPYGDGPVFAELTYNRENSLSDELLIAAGWVDVGKYALHRGPGSPLLRAVFEHMPEYDWDEIGRVYVVAIAYGGCYGWANTIADVYVSPNIDDDYDVARWQAQLIADAYPDRGIHPVWDTCGGFGDTIDGLEGDGYPYGQNDDRMPMYDVSAVTYDAERGCHQDADGETMPATMAGTADGYMYTYSGPWLACGGAGVFAIGADGRVHRVYGSVS